MNVRNLTTDVTCAMLLTEPLLLPGFSALIYFLWCDKIFVRMEWITVKNLCFLVP